MKEKVLEIQIVKEKLSDGSFYFQLQIDGVEYCFDSYASRVLTGTTCEYGYGLFSTGRSNIDFRFNDVTFFVEFEKPWNIIEYDNLLDEIARRVKMVQDEMIKVTENKKWVQLLRIVDFSA